MAQIGKSLQLKGEITGSEDLLINGEVEGVIELKENSLTVGPNGNVKADVSARSITVMGHLRGNVPGGREDRDLQDRFARGRPIHGPHRDRRRCGVSWQHRYRQAGPGYR